MSEQILEKINQYKERVKSIVQDIQSLKGKLERAEIPLKDFKASKALMEDELRGILQQIAKTKETHKIKPAIRGKELPSPEDEIIDKEISIAEEAKELMYYFQTDFETTVTHAKVYLSITLDAHFIIGVDYEDYPQKPQLEIPQSILKQNNQSLEEFYKNIPSYDNWDPDNPKRIYELITEIETVLINMYSADVESITKKSIEYSKKSQKLSKLVEEANYLLSIKDYDKAIEIINSVINAANEMGDHVLVEKYTKNLNDVIRLNTESKDKYFV
jgi:tetratricopeptide (TPR) repeat protein